MGAMPGRVGGKARKKLYASVTSISPVVFNECATLYLEPKSSAPCGTIQRDEGWNCKGAPRRRGKRKPLTLPHNTTSRAFTNTRAAVLPVTAPFFNTIRPAPQGRSGKEKSNPAQKGLFRRGCGDFFGGISSAIVSFSDFFAFFGGFSGTQTTRLLSEQIREK